jgi:hypothetical protein
VFSIVCDLGFAVGIATHDVPKIGTLVWMAEPTFDDKPSIEQVKAISEWRWPIYFPLAAAIRRKIVVPIGIIPVPPVLEGFPVMRSGNKRSGWIAFERQDGESRSLGRTTDPSLPISRVVNDTALKEKIVSGWRPEDEW